MVTFGPVNSKVCIAYSRCPCNKLWRRSECLNISTIEVNRPSTKTIAKQIFGAIFYKSLNNFRVEGQKWIVYKKRCIYTGYNFFSRLLVSVLELL